MAPKKRRNKLPPPVRSKSAKKATHKRKAIDVPQIERKTRSKTKP